MQLSTAANEKRVTQITLDRLPFGNYTADSITGKEKISIPSGVTRKELIRDGLVIAWPSLVELMLTQLTSMADQIMVGNMSGTAGVIGLSAVNLAAQPKFLLMTMVIAMNTGATAIVAKYRGQQNQKTANQVFRQSLLLNIFVSAIMMVLGLLLTNPLIDLMSGSGITDQTREQAAIYLRIQMYGMIPLCMTFSVTSALRGIGDSRTPMLYNTLANVVNLFFNYVMIYGHFGCPEMGVAGASIATVIGQMFAFVVAFFVMFHGKRYLVLNLKEKFYLDRKLLSEVINIGIPSMVEQFLMRVGMMVLTRQVSGLGEVQYAAHSICFSVQSVSFMLGQAFGTATTTLMGQSLGKRRYDMAVLYMRYTRAIGIAISCLLGLCMVLFRSQVMEVYNKNIDVINSGAPIILVIGIMQPVLAAQFITSGGLRGAGDTRYTALVTAITVFILRTSLVLLLVGKLNFGLNGAWIAIMADQICRSTAFMVRYNGGKWAKMALNNAGYPDLVVEPDPDSEAAPEQV